MHTFSHDCPYETENDRVISQASSIYQVESLESTSTV